MAFKILQKDHQARLGRLKTAHGTIDTPNFIPVGTQGAVKALSPKDIQEIGCQAVLANTYHLILRPGIKVIEKMGGLHKFMNWSGPIMTDSGGFQVFSLGVALEHGVGKLLKEKDYKDTKIKRETKPRLNKITEKGVYFQSHIDGSKQYLDAEKSIDLQLKLGADLIVAFDDLESPLHSYEETLKSLELTEKWELRSLKEYQSSLRVKRSNPAHLRIGQDRHALRTHDDNVPPLLYGVTHGGVFKDLRIKSAKFVDFHFEGIALGGAHKDKKTLYQVIDWTLSHISEQKPRHLLGIGEVVDIFEAVKRGVDLFDCAAPTRRARHGSLYTKAGTGKAMTIDIKQSKFKLDKGPIDSRCQCYTCQNFSRCYLHHLYVSGEILYFQLSSLHNIYYINNLMAEIRKAIEEGYFEKLSAKWLGKT